MRSGFILLAAVASLLLMATAHAYVAQPLSQGECSQVNATFVSCTDGVPIAFSFTVSGPDASGFGSFSITPLDYANVSEPLDSFGNACRVGSGATAYCTVTLNPMPIFSLNGTVRKEIRLRLDSISYPQLAFNYSVNVTIYHYLDRNESLFVDAYSAASSQYMLENETYLYLCNSYDICNSEVSYRINVAGSYLTLAGYDAKLDLVLEAMDNTSMAAGNLAGGLAQYDSFVNASDRIVNNVIHANYLLAAVNNSYLGNRKAIGNCTVGNATYSENIGRQLNATKAYPMQNTLNGSVRYLQGVRNLSAYNTAAVARCSAGYGNGRGIPFLHDIGGNGLLEIIAGVVAAILVIYAVLRYRGYREVKRIRDAATDEAADEEKRHGEQPEAEAGADEKAPKDPAAEG